MMPKDVSFKKVVDELLDGTREISRRSLQEFSDLDPASLEVLFEAWPRISPDRKRLLLDGLLSEVERDTLVSFDDLARALLTDSDAQVRTRAIRLLDECEDVKLIPAFLKILNEDDDNDARGEAARALGKYVELGELEEIPEKTFHQVEDALLKKVNSEDRSAVRRAALEALGFSSRLEVITAIESAFRREDPDWQSSALLAMGRSFDERWEEQILSRLFDENLNIRLAAVEAAGELRLASARTILLKLLDDEEDDDIVAAAIWSLSQVGGEDARVYIESLLDLAEEQDQIEFLEEALDNLAFTEDLNHFDLISYDTDDEE